MQGVLGQAAARHLAGQRLGALAAVLGVDRVVQAQLEPAADVVAQVRADLGPAVGAQHHVHAVVQAGVGDLLDVLVELLEVAPQRRPVVDQQEDVGEHSSSSSSPRARGARTSAIEPIAEAPEARSRARSSRARTWRTVRAHAVAVELRRRPRPRGAPPPAARGRRRRGRSRRSAPRRAVNPRISDAASVPGRCSCRSAARLRSRRGRRRRRGRDERLGALLARGHVDEAQRHLEAAVGRRPSLPPGRARGEPARSTSARAAAPRPGAPGRRRAPRQARDQRVEVALAPAPSPSVSAPAASSATPSVEKASTAVAGSAPARASASAEGDQRDLEPLVERGVDLEVGRAGERRQQVGVGRAEHDLALRRRVGAQADAGSAGGSRGRAAAPPRGAGRRTAGACPRLRPTRPMPRKRSMNSGRRRAARRTRR